MGPSSRNLGNSDAGEARPNITESPTRQPKEKLCQLVVAEGSARDQNFQHGTRASSRYTAERCATSSSGDSGDMGIPLVLGAHLQGRDLRNPGKAAPARENTRGPHNLDPRPCPTAPENQQTPRPKRITPGRAATNRNPRHSPNPNTERNRTSVRRTRGHVHETRT